MESTILEKRERMVQIRLCAPTGAYTETLWASPIDADLYQLDNSPFFAYGVSWQDIVEARLGDDHVLEFVRCVTKSGNRTVRIILQDVRTTDRGAEDILAGLRNLGCSYEGMQPRMVSVNVPPSVDLGAVADFLKQQSGLQWEYADPTYEQITSRQN